MSTKFDLIDAFSTRPTVSSVARERLSAALEQQFPGKGLLPDACVITRTTADGEKKSETLLANLLYVFAKKRTPRWSSEKNQLVVNPSATVPDVIPIDFEQLGVVVDSVALALAEDFEQAMVEFWRRSQAGGKSPWALVSDTLREHLASAVASHSVLSDAQRALMTAITSFGEKSQRDFMLKITEKGQGDVIRACVVDRAPQTQPWQLPVPWLAVTGKWQGVEVFLSWQPAGDLQTHASLLALEDALSLTAADAGQAPRGRLRETEDDIFDVLAQVVFDNQLQALRSADLAQANTTAELELCLSSILDITPVLYAGQPAVAQWQHLPQWLRDARPGDRLDFSRRTSALASAQAQSGGQGFNDGLPSLLAYANEQLQKKIDIDHPEDGGLSVVSLDVLINKVTGAAVASGGQVVALGSVEPERTSVAEFALGNLSSVPSGTLSVVSRDASQVPEWFTSDYLKLLVCHVDIGRTYPALVQRVLIDDHAQRTRRQALFARQLSIQLPLKALEQKLRGEGISKKGYRRVAAIMQTADQRDSDMRQTVVMPLAFRASAGRAADKVADMFVIADRDPTVGPVVLYRPLSSHGLTEFESWGALRAAIAAPGELQNEVLAWMSEQAQPVYANGGFDEPHLLRFGLGSDFAPIETPQPAQLVHEAVVGDLMTVLYDANAQALVALADRQSVSDAESRWAMLKRGGWLALNAVMPFISGSAGTALWLVQLMSDVQAVLAQAPGDDGHQRSVQMGELLLSLSMILLHHGLSFGTRGLAVRRPEAEAQRTPVVAHPVDEFEPTTAGTVLDFSWTSMNDRLTPSQSAALQRFKVTDRPALEPASDAPEAEGLCRGADAWYASVGDDLFQVQWRDEALFVVDPLDANVTGPRLVRDGAAWRLDLSLRLRGGAPKRNARQMALDNAATLKRVVAQKTALVHRQAALIKEIADYDKSLQTVPAQMRGQVTTMFEAALRETIEIIEKKQVLDQELRPADRMGEKAYGKDLQGISRRVCLFEGILLNDMLKSAREDSERMNAMSGDSVTSSNVDIYLGLFEKVLALQETGVHWSGVREKLWQQLREVPKVGEAYWREEVLELHESNMFTALEWKISRMWSYLELCFSRESILQRREALALKALRLDEPLHAALTSQVELEKPNDYSMDEQIGVLESSLREYNRASIIAMSVFESEPAAVEKARFSAFLDDLSAISDNAEARLSDLIRETQEPALKPSEYAPRVKQPRRRVIKTQGQRTLIGRLREGEEPLHGEVVEVKDTVGNRVIGSYHQHAEGEWVELETRRPMPPVRESVVALSELLRRGQALLERVEPDIASAQRQARRVSEPEDMEDILVQKADKLRDLAGKLGMHEGDEQLTDETRANLATVLADLQAGEARLREQGRSLRIAMIKRQPPTAARVNYLYRQREVDIARVDGRKNMSGARRNDFMQEYVIRDKDHSVLWWAHFHYAGEADADAAFTAAHLKLPDQRFLGYKALVKAARDNKEVVSIYRSAIGKELAKRLFLQPAVSPVQPND